MSQVPATRTPISHKDLMAALAWAYRSQLGHEAANKTLAVLCAQVALETGGGTSCVQFNIGNYKRGPGPDWCSFQTFEYVGTPPVKTTMVCEFSAWPSLNEAADFFVHSLYSTYPEAWSGAVTGDPVAFSEGLRKRGYFTAPVYLYAKGVSRWQTYYLDLLGGDADATLPEVMSAGDASVWAITGLLDEAPDSEA